jgi:thiol-disulfide isomerase/thioredoxin
MKKNIALAITIVLVVGAIIYLESTKAGPGAATGNGSAQSIAVSPTTSNAGGAGTAGTSGSTQTALAAIAAADRRAGHSPALEIADPTGFVNATSGFNLAGLIGKKVILLDFWTYSCINCIRTIPYLDAWYQKYSNEGLEIVGIHTPEFDFEKQISNVQTAVAQYGIQYPVVLDSDYGTWTAYGNLYWPSEYLIDIAGYVVHNSIGEGNYAQTEAEIQQLLAQRDVALGLPNTVSSGTVNVAAANLNEIESPETYFGAERNQTLANGAQGETGVQDLMLPTSDTTLNELYLGGKWDFESQYAMSEASGTTILFQYDAGKVYFVAGAAQTTTIQVIQDGQPVGPGVAGSDVVSSTLTVGPNRLYNVINNASGGGGHTLELIVHQPGLQAFTFTFG